jgi:hypothetical protein
VVCAIEGVTSLARARAGSHRRVAGGLHGAAGHEVVDAAQRDAEADLRGVRATHAGARGRAGLERLLESVLERRAGGLEADRVDVGQVVGRDVQHDLLRLEA